MEMFKLELDHQSNGQKDKRYWRGEDQRPLMARRNSLLPQIQRTTLEQKDTKKIGADTYKEDQVKALDGVAVWLFLEVFRGFSQLLMLHDATFGWIVFFILLGSGYISDVALVVPAPTFRALWGLAGSLIITTLSRLYLFMGQCTLCTDKSHLSEFDDDAQDRVTGARDFWFAYRMHVHAGFVGVNGVLIGFAVGTFGDGSESRAQHFAWLAFLTGLASLAYPILLWFNRLLMRNHLSEGKGEFSADEGWMFGRFVLMLPTIMPYLLVTLVHLAVRDDVNAVRTPVTVIPALVPFRGFGQVFFESNEYTALLLFMAAGVFERQVAKAALLGAVVSSVISLAWSNDIVDAENTFNVANGIHGFNGVLVSVAIAAFTINHPWHFGAFEDNRNSSDIERTVEQVWWIVATVVSVIIATVIDLALTEGFDLDGDSSPPLAFGFWLTMVVFVILFANSTIFTRIEARVKTDATSKSDVNPGE